MINLLRSGIVFVLLLSGCGWNGTPTRQNDFTPLTSIEISAVSSTIAAGTSTKLTAIGNFSGLFTRDVTDQVVWSSDTNAKIIIAANSRRAQGIAPGPATLTATTVGGGVSATFTLTVSNATVTAVTITPVNQSISQGSNIQFAASGTFSGTPTTTQDLTFDATWASTPGTLATISNDPTSKGLATALKVGIGIETITATFPPLPLIGVSGSTTLTVTVPELQSITISPANPSVLSLSTSGSFTATGHFSDGSNPDITSRVAWTSSDKNIATIALTGGAATTLSSGTISITATPLPGVPSILGVTGTTALKVTGGNLNVNGITLSPAIVTLANNTRVRITATGTFSNGSSRDITDAVVWSVANSNLATVTPPVGKLAFLNAGAAAGTTTVSAAFGTVTTPPNTNLTVTTSQPLLSFAISTASAELNAGSLTAGTSARFTATANFNGVLQDVTTLSTWTSSVPATASFDNINLANKGRITGVAAGSTTIIATYTNNGILTSVQFPVTVTVTTRGISILSISPVATTVGSGNKVQFTATATYNGGFSKDVTEDTTWSISNPNVAILADSANQPGQVVGVDIGSATLTATLGALAPTTTITVTGP